MIFRKSIEKFLQIYWDLLLLIDDDFITKNLLGRVKVPRSLECDDFKTVLVNVGNLSSPLFLSIVFSPPPPVNSNFVKERLGNGRYASSTVSFLLQYQFQTRAVQARATPDDRRAYANRMQVTNCL